MSELADTFRKIEKEPGRNARLRLFLRDAGDHDMAARKAIIDACSKDILFYVNYFCWTFDPRQKNGYVPFVTYDFQDEALLAIQETINASLRTGEDRVVRDVCIVKSRDMGASWMNVLVPEFDWHFSKEPRSYLLVSRNESYVDEKNNTKTLFGKIDALLAKQPRWLWPKGYNPAKHRALMTIYNPATGSVINGESTTGEVGRGDRRTAILMDEFAAFDVKSANAALAATSATTYCRVFNSTPKGMGHPFYNLYKKSSARVVELHWSKHPMKNKGLYRHVRNTKTGRLELRLLSDWRGVVSLFDPETRTMKKVAFPEDYPFVADEKLRSPWYDNEVARSVNKVEIAQELDMDFCGSEYQFFDAVEIERYMERWCREPEFVGDLEYEAERCSLLRVTETPKGRFRMFEALGRDGHVERDRRFVMGVDVSAGTGASNSTIAVYDAKTREKVAEYVNPKILPDDFGRLAVAVAKFFNNALVVPDRSGPTGEVFVRRMIAQDYDRIYRRRNEKKVGAPVVEEYGVWLNPSVKTETLQKYRDAIMHDVVMNRSQVAMEETLRFIMLENGCVEHSAAGSSSDPSGARANHGDLVIADALAVLALSDDGAVEEPKTQEIPQDTLAYRMHLDRMERMEAKQDTLGGEWNV